MTEPLHTRISSLLSERLKPLLESLSELRDPPGPNAYTITQAVQVLREALPLVESHETGKRIADIFCPVTGTWSPTLVEGCVIKRLERLPSGNMAIHKDDLLALHSRINALLDRLGALANPANPSAGAAALLICEANGLPSPVVAEQIAASLHEPSERLALDAPAPTLWEKLEGVAGAVGRTCIMRGRSNDDDFEIVFVKNTHYSGGGGE